MNRPPSTELEAGLGAGTVAAMRRQFDAAFTVPPPGPGVRQLEVLTVRIATDLCAIRLEEISGLVAGPVVTPVPGQLPSSLGVTTVRGVTVAVYDLAMITGRGETACARWMVLTAIDPGLGLVFDGFDGHLRVPDTDLTGDVGPCPDDRPPLSADSAPASPGGPRLLTRDGSLVPILRIGSLIESLDRLILQRIHPKE